jgi:hypothetical protein
MKITVCDRGDCENLASYRVEFTGEDHEWKGVAFDLCKRHGDIGRHLRELEAERRKSRAG